MNQQQLNLPNNTICQNVMIPYLDGGFSNVYLVVNGVLKVAKPDSNINNEMVILQTVDKLSPLAREYFPQIYSYDATTNVIHMEYLGLDLDTAMYENKVPYSLPFRMYVLHSLAKAASFLHSLKIIHMDLKLENVMWRNDLNILNEHNTPSIKLIDFEGCFNLATTTLEKKPGVSSNIDYTSSPIISPPETIFHNIELTDDLKLFKKVLQSIYAKYPYSPTLGHDIWSWGVDALILLEQPYVPLDSHFDVILLRKLCKFLGGGKRSQSISSTLSFFDKKIKNTDIWQNYIQNIYNRWGIAAEKINPEFYKLLCQCFELDHLARPNMDDLAKISNNETSLG